MTHITVLVTGLQRYCVSMVWQELSLPLAIASSYSGLMRHGARSHITSRTESLMQVIYLMQKQLHKEICMY